MRALLLSTLVLAACNIDTGINDGKNTTFTEPDITDPEILDSDLDGSPDAEDCDDDNQDIHPGALELCDEVDNDCDGEVDGVFDQDDDGFLDAEACWQMGGDLDCDDTNPDVNPRADEICDGMDNNCDGATDDVDADLDGYSICTVDCDDTNPFVFPGAPEACDGVDNDCSGTVDEIWDFDGDGTSACAGDCDDDDPEIGPDHGDPCDGIDNDCSGIVDDAFDLDLDGVTTCTGDCDDGDATVYPGAPEICDGQDNDCDPGTEETVDGDGDGWTVCTGDCDDADTRATPAGTESCDAVDNDCSGYADDLPECWSCTLSGSYYLCTETQDWNTAENACEGLGGTLAIITSSSENTTVSDLSTTPTWIGATDQAEEGVWMEPDGVTTIGYENWTSGEPDGGSSSNCASINEGGRRGYWGDETCATGRRFVCEL